MQVPLEISCPDFDKTETIETIVEEEAGKLERFCDHIISCRTTIEMPHKHQQTGNPFRVKVEVHVPPQHTLVSKRESTGGNLHEELPAVLRDAFDAVERQLKKTVDKQHGEVKSHPLNEVAGVICKIFREEGYGFIETIDGGEVYFHENSVLHGDFDRLAIGTGVRYVERSGEDGPQASSVQIVDKPGVRMS